MDIHDSPNKKLTILKVSSILWLDNTRFLNIYGSTEAENRDSATFLVTKQNDQFSFQKFAIEPTFPSPSGVGAPHYFINRLRDYEPNLKDTLIVASTGSADVGLLANSSPALSNNSPETSDNYALVSFEDDTQKAEIPMLSNDPGQDSISLGVALDFSSNEPVKSPIKKEEGLEQTSMPLPALMALNHEGCLVSWWFVNSASVLQNKIYKHMNAAIDAPKPQANSIPSQGATSSQPAFGQSGFSGMKSPSFGTPQAAATGSSPWSSQQSGQKFGQPSFGTPAFGSPSQPSRGGSTALGGNTPSGNQKLFGSGTPSMPSPFSQAGAQNQGAQSSPFGGLAKNNAASSSSPFGAVHKNSDTPLFGKSSPLSESKTPAFSAQAQKTGWSFGEPEQKEEKQPLFGQKPSFGSTMTIGSSFGSLEAPSGIASHESPWATPSLSNNTSDGVKSGSSKPQDEDADMDMDKKQESLFGEGVSSLGLSDKSRRDAQEVARDSDREETPKPTKPSQSDKQATPEAVPLPPDPFEAKSTQSKPQGPEPEKAPLPPEASNLSSSPKTENTPNTLQTPAKAENKDEKVTSSTPPTPPRSLKTNEQFRTQDKPSKDDDEPSLAGSEPEIVEAEKSIPASPTRSITAATDDVTQDLDKAGTWPRSKSPIQPTPSKSLFGEQTPSQAFTFTDSKTPQSAATPSTLPKPPVFFQRPDESPRSPSPIRAGQRRIASPTRRPGSGLSPARAQAPSPDRSTDRTVSSPAPVFAPTPKHQPRPSGLVNQITPSKSSPAPSETPPQSSMSQMRPQPAARAPSPAPSVDFGPAEEAEKHVKAELNSALNLTRQLRAFTASASYVTDVGGTSIASQVERLYRDGNSMVDALGLNARTLKSFIGGHQELYKESGRDVGDLEGEKLESWVLDEVDSLHLLVNDLERRLDAETPRDVQRTLVEIRDFHRDTLEMRRSQTTIAGQLREIAGTAHGGRRARLSPQQSSVVRELRAHYAELQTLLSRAEDAVSLLRARIVAVESQQRSEGGGKEMPTYEAVINTIAKMTRMAEERRGNVDLLEARLRKLRKDLGRSDNEGLRSSRIGGSTPRQSARYSTPPSSQSARKGLLAVGGNGRKKKDKQGFGLSYSDSDSDADNDSGVIVKREDPEVDDLAGQTKALAMCRSRFRGSTCEELQESVAREKNRRRVLSMFRDHVIYRGVKWIDKTV